MHCVVYQCKKTLGSHWILVGVKLTARRNVVMDREILLLQSTNKEMISVNTIYNTAFKYERGKNNFKFSVGLQIVWSYVPFFTKINALVYV
jgi:hypothetical protein